MKLFRIIFSSLLILSISSQNVFCMQQESKKRLLDDGYQTDPDKYRKKDESGKRGLKDKPESLSEKKCKKIDQKSILYRFATDSFKNYKEYSKRADSSQKFENPIIKIQEFNNIVDGFIKLYTVQSPTDFLNTAKWVDGKAPDANLLRDCEKDLNFRHPYAQKLDVDSQSHIVTFGDIHGSLHSLLRNLWRLYAKGFIDENLKILDPNGYIIFLGDLVDRGRYSVEVLFLAMIIKLENPDKAFILRGNHEDPKMGGNYTIRTELNDKYSKYPEIVSEVLKKLNCIYDLLPFVLFVGSDKKYTIFSHAGVDPSYNPVNLLSSKQVYECLKGTKENSVFLDEQIRQGAVEHFNSMEAMPVGPQTGFYCFGFNWCDFARYKNSKSEVIHNPDKITFSGHGYNISIEVFEKYLTDLNKKLSKAQISILGLVRGHQHMSYGLTMLNKNIKVTDGQAQNWTSVAQCSDIFSTSGFSMYKYFPIYTLMSAPEGVGRDNAHGIEVKFDQDAFCMITTGDWLIKPFSYEISKRSEEGLYCSIPSFSASEDPIKCSYTQMPATTQMPAQTTVCDKGYQFRDQAVDAEVDFLFGQLKGIMGKKLESHEYDVRLLQNPLAYPITSDIKTQSLNHVRLLSKKEQLQRDDFDKFMGEHTEHQNLVENLIHQEILHKDEYFVFYHGHKGNLTVLYDILKLFYSWGFLRHNQPLALRFIDSGRYAKDLSTFLDQHKDQKTYIDEYGIEQVISWFDQTPEFLMQLLSTNMALFGNYKLGGETSFDYFQENHSVSPCDVKKVLQNIFAQIQIPEIFLNSILRVTEKFTKQVPQGGRLLQIFIKKDVVDQVAYWAFPGGRPVDQKVFDECWDESKNRHTKISTLLQMYQDDSNGLDGLVSRAHHKGVAHEYDLSLNKTQARIWLPCSYFYDPGKTKIFRYGTDVSDSNYQLYLSELNTVFEEIVKYFIKQKLTNQTAPFQHMSTPLKELDYLVSSYKIDKLKNETNKLINSLDLEIKRDYISPEQEFFMFIKQIQEKNGIDQQTEERLQQILPMIKKLPGVTTPLILAVKINNAALVELIMRFNQCDPQAFAQDETGKTALDWCGVTGNRKIKAIIYSLIDPKIIKQVDYELAIYLADKMDNANILSMIKALADSLVSSECEKAFILAEKIIATKNISETLQWAMGLAEKIADKNSYRAFDLAEKILDKNYDLKILELAMKVADKIVDKDLWRAYYLAEKILDKNSDFETLQWAMKVADKFADKGSIYAYYLAKKILYKNSDFETLQWAMKVADKFADKDSEDAYYLAEKILDKNSDLETLQWAMKVADKIAEKDFCYASSLAEKIFDKNCSPATLEWAKDIAKYLLDRSLAEKILDKNSDLETLEWAMKFAEKIAKKDLHAYVLVLKILDKNSDLEILQWAMKVADKIIAEKNSCDAYYLVPKILDKNNSLATLQWAMKVAEKIAEHNTYCACNLVKEILDKNSSLATLQWAMGLACQIDAKDSEGALSLRNKIDEIKANSKT